MTVNSESDCMTKVVAIFNVDTNSNFKKRLKNDRELQNQKQEDSFSMFMKHALEVKKVKIHE
ncbi:MAG: hypothetical protein K0R55_3596 [Sporomusa sp.]|nr:hypothetical protein [Sporomusa sp.]